MTEIEPWRYCANCDKQYCYHVDAKCPFEASNFKKKEGFFALTTPGIGIVNRASISKLFFDISTVNLPAADPSK